MGIIIEVPEADTAIVFNVAGKSVKQAAEEIGMFAYMLNKMTELPDDYKDGWVWHCENEEAALNIIKPLSEHLQHREWNDDAETSFSSGSIITGYMTRGKDVEVDVIPGFIDFAKTGRPLEEYCREQIHNFKKQED